jgi:phenylpyruvate tautomerase PptA (4-oxalocrotonate tautomerase family)
MAQVKIYGLRSALQPLQQAISEGIHGALMAAFQLPPDRSEHYTIIEISCFEGRSVESKKQQIGELYERLGAVGVAPQDLEITISETPRHNWGIRGAPGDELNLNYQVNI